MAAAAASEKQQLSPTELTNITMVLRCPVTHEIYSDRDKAVSLVAQGTICGHAVSESAAKALISRRQACPICREEITRYIPNPQLNQIAEMLFDRGDQGAVPMISEKIAVDPEIDIATVPYPGPGAKFVVLQKGWCIAGDLFWEIRFQSQNKESPWKEFTVLGYQDGSLKLTLERRERLSQLCVQYWSSLDIPVDRVDALLDQDSFQSLAVQKKVLRVLALHNEIPEPEFALLRRLITEGVNWKTIPEDQLGFGPLPPPQGERLFLLNRLAW